MNYDGGDPHMPLTLRLLIWACVAGVLAWGAVVLAFMIVNTLAKC